MAGGTYSGQSKRQPGVYINVLSERKHSSVVGDRGIVTICKPLSWGPEGEVAEILAGSDHSLLTGYGVNEPEMLFLREIFTGSDHTAPAFKVLLYRPQLPTASEATAVSGALSVTAKYKGTRGNDISVLVSDTGAEMFLVQTFVNAVKKDEQEAATVEDLTANAWVTFSGTGALDAGALKLQGGADGELTTAAYAEYLTAIEPYTFNILIYDGEDETVKVAVAAFAKRIRETTGRKLQAVVSNMAADSEAVISVRNGYVLSDGTSVSAAEATWWVGGAEAGARHNESLVYAIHPNAVDAAPKLTSDEIDTAIEAGQIVFMEEFGKVKAVSDINTLTTYSKEKGDFFSLNQVIRILDTICNDTYKVFSTNYIGRTQNNPAGRDLLKGWLVGYLNELQANEAIQNFAPEDVAVAAGEAINAVVIDVAIQPVGAIDKIYITVKLTDG